jgi:hypothetical protein
MVFCPGAAGVEKLSTQAGSESRGKIEADFPEPLKKNTMYTPEFL